MHCPIWLALNNATCQCLNSQTGTRLHIHNACMHCLKWRKCGQRSSSLYHALPVEILYTWQWGYHISIVIT